MNQFVDEKKKVDGQWPKEYGTVVLKPKAEDFLLGAFKPVAGLDGTKVGDLSKKDASDLKPDEKAVLDARMYSGRMALKVTAWIPAGMAVGYLILAIYFRAKGGYRVEVLHGAKPEGEHYTGGVEGPVEA